MKASRCYTGARQSVGNPTLNRSQFMQQIKRIRKARQEHPPISSDFVYASFERAGISLMDTWEIGTRTKFWRDGE